MTKTELSFREPGLLVGTRGMLGAGFRAAARRQARFRQTQGGRLDASGIGMLSTIPRAWIVFGHRKKTQQLPSNRGEPYAKRTEADAYAAAR
jgi:hypothetical protein